ncbi:MAG: amino acid racemase [Hyphomicrobiales bacterium]|nr:amino acid racemase [Hyphomicrobiales bacterium]MCP5370857.1 amino acid racemase [Hyphomicrobiales bacterium]
MTQTIGIVACSAEGAALCYRTICAEGEAGAGHGHPPVVLHGHSLAAYEDFLTGHDWGGVAGLMLDSAARLARAGADFLICPDNTIHQALPGVLPRSPLPWLHIAQVVADAAQARGFRRLGITGTRWLVEGPVYTDVLEARRMDAVRPDAPARDTMNRIIMTELVAGVVRPESVAAFQEVIAGLAAVRCDAVVLGCTEIPLIIDDSNSPLPTLDSTRLLARAALARARGAA